MHTKWSHGVNIWDKEITMKNKLMDLNNHLFAQLERLSDEDITRDGLDTEINRTRAICLVSTQIIENAGLALRAYKAINDGLIKDAPGMLGMEVPDGE
jgi:hypothetical protein